MKFKYIFILFLFSSLTLFAQENRIRLIKNKDSLKHQIELMLADDQKYRWMLEFGELNEQKVDSYKNMSEKEKFNRIRNVQERKVGLSIMQADSIEKLQEAIDTINFYKLSDIIYDYGFPNKYIEQYKATTILMHSPQSLISETFFKMLKEEVISGNLAAIEYARLYDRIQLRKGLSELYFVDEHYNFATQKTELGIPINLVKTNQARKEIGLKIIKN